MARFKFQPRKQTWFLAYDAYDGQESLFGGAAGSGKSRVLLAAALHYVDHIGYSVPMTPLLQRWASWSASCMTLRARSENRSHINASRVSDLASAILPHSTNGASSNDSM